MLKRRRVILCLCLAIAGILLLETLFYKVVVILLAIVLCRRHIVSASPWKHLYVTLLLLCVVLLWFTSPRIRWDTSDRVRLIYQDESYTARNMPLHHWLLATVIPEAEVMNVGLPIVRYTGKFFLNEWSHFFNLPPSLVEQFVNGEGLSKFTYGYRELERHGQFIPSGVVSQTLNMVGEKSRAVYVIRPKHFDKNKTYPVVIHLHGYLGNWQLFQGLLLGYDDYIVLSPSTPDLYGRWNNDDLQDIVTHQLSFLESIGYNIDRGNVHLVGLSNGAYYGASEAVRHFSNTFRSVTFIVGAKTTDKTHPHEHHIYGRYDAACPPQMTTIDERRSTQRYLYFPCCGHCLFAYHPEEIRQWLLERWADE